VGCGGVAWGARRHVYGLAGDVADNIHYADETTVIYPAGHNVVLYNIEQKVQRHIAGTWLRARAAVHPQ
jgi:hypothetical protein